MSRLVRVLRWVISLLLFAVALYALLAKEDVIGALLFGVVGWAVKPKRRQPEADAAL